MRGFSQTRHNWNICKCYQFIIVSVILFLIKIIIIINNMLLSLLWDEIVADDMMMFSVKVMKLLISNVLLKLNSKSYHVVKEKRIIYDAILKTRHERNSKIFFFSPCLVLVRGGLTRKVENVMWKFQKLNFASSFCWGLKCNKWP